MHRFRWLVVLLALCIPVVAYAITPNSREVSILGTGVKAVLSLNFASLSALPAGFTFSRATIASDALYTDAPGSTFNSFISGQPRLTARGLLIESSRTNFFLNSTAPVTHTTGNLVAPNVFLAWCTGTGSIVTAAGTAIGSGFGAQSCSSNSFQSITITSTGNIGVTVIGSVDRFQLENGGAGGGSMPTSLVVTGGGSLNRAADIITATPTAAGFPGGPSQSTVVMQYMLPAEFSLTTNQAFWAWSDNTLNNRVTVLRTPTGVTQMISAVAGSAKAAASTGDSSIGVYHGIAAGFDNTGYSLSLDNGSEVAQIQPIPAPSALTQFNLGNIANGQAQVNGFVQTLTMYPRRFRGGALTTLSVP